MTNPIATLSRERLEQLADENTICKVSWDERIEMSRAMLAVMDAKPFGYLFTGPAGLVVSPVNWPCEGLILQGTIWATPPAPSAPDGWIKCSDQLPPDDDFVLIWPTPDFGVDLHVGQYMKFHKKGAGWFAQVNEQNYGIEWYPIAVTHWMPLPATPGGE